MSDSKKSSAARCKQRLRDLIYLDKISKGCSRCPERRPNCLDYHHLDPSSKKSGVGRMVGQKLGVAAVLEEINKCILLCSNCHRVQEFGTGFREVKPEPPLKLVDKKELSSWVNMIIDG